VLRFLFRTPYITDAVVFIAGLLLVLAFAPFYLFPLAIVSPALLFLAWVQSTPGRAAWRGFLFGAGLFGGGVSWVYVSLHTFGNMSMPLAIFTVLLFVSLLSLYLAVLGWFQGRFFHGPAWLRVIVVMPALWILVEWWRGWFLSGFPWLNLGYSQSPSIAFNLAPWIGVYGVGYATAIMAGLLAWVLLNPKRYWVKALSAGAVLVLVVFLTGLADWTQPNGKPIKVALIQGNVSLAKKWDPDYLPYILQRYLALSRESGQPRLIVWPEAAIPTYLNRLDPGFIAQMRKEAKSANSTYIIGAIEQEQKGKQFKLYNSAVLIGQDSGTYRKRHLVPFGEFVPLRFLFNWLVQSVNIPMSDFSVGGNNQPQLTIAGQKIGISICYEDAFGEEVLRSLPAANLLVNISEDAWFGKSLASPQRLQMAQMRAREAGRMMVRAANTGITAVIDHTGKVVARSPQFQQQILLATVQPRTGATPYARLGNWPLISALTFLLVGVFWRRRR